MARSLILFAALGATAAYAQETPAPVRAAVQSAGPQASASGGKPSEVRLNGLKVSPGLRQHRNMADDDIPAFMEGDSIDGDPAGDITITGNAQLRRIDTVLKGDRINYNQATGDMVSEGNARLMRDGSLVTGPNLLYNADNQTGYVEKPNFWLGANGASGRAEYGDIFSRSRMRLTDVVYTGCACEKPAWYIDSSKVDLDFDENEGVARNAVLYFKGVPILASPYLTFPIKAERKSGFLLPTYGTTSRGGFDFSLPYYFNLHPQYDMTLTPRLLSKRGTMLGGEFRYLGATYSGEIAGTYLGSDNVTGEKRWLYSARHRQRLGGGFYFDWDLNGVSDDDYFRDISTVGLNEASTTYLTRSGRFGWGSTYWQAYVEATSYQTLQDPDAPLTPQYDRLPSFYLRGARYNWNGLDAEWETTATRFSRPLFLDVTDRSWANGDRLMSYPTISFPIVRPGWYITPKAGVHMTQYHTDWPGALRGRPSVQSRTLPILSLDSGMTFERDTTLFGKSSIQTLEPRMYYLYVPYRDQASLPIYDTALSNFSFAQAFDENIYSGGWDRIANANQVTLGLTSRWLDANTGFERLSLSGAQRLYFTDQRVTLGEAPRTGVRSDFLVGASAAVTDTLSTQVTAQYNPHTDNWERSVIAARWRPQRLTTIAVSYRYQRVPPVNALYAPPGREQISVSAQWPFSRHWFGVGRVDYSLQESRSTQSIAGLEYKSDCCWAARVVFQRYAVAANEANTGIFFQLELSGLGSLGTNPMNLLSRSVTGYEEVTDPVRSSTSFERYE
ncbi:Outer membrane protein Imp, required for envelope biogenesis / Organic solvent tolerance protein precursor [plant metagenome]|uniref:Outer membrane protein Imp, required for envelope biogenesis / Organic solvent tolerance protein n=1 Tax=plant metagenome TaxID=1297885 RepID=A0A484UZL5_9ZZZZ